jgi:tetratricopeptide (TPR) repeat protein
LLSGLNAEKSPYDSEHRVAGLLLLGQILVRNGDLDGAAHAYEAAGKQARSESGRAEAILGLAKVHTARDEVTEARRYYSQLRQGYAPTPAGLLAPLEEIRLLQRRGDSVEVREFLPVAIQTYRGVIAQFGTERPALLAARCMSECMGVAGHWDHGVAFLDSISTTFGSDPRAGSLLVRAARLAVERLDDRDRAQQILGRVQSRLPDSDVAVLARSYEDSLGLALQAP